MSGTIKKCILLAVFASLIAAWAYLSIIPQQFLLSFLPTAQVSYYYSQNYKCDISVALRVGENSLQYSKRTYRVAINNLANENIEPFQYIMETDGMKLTETSDANQVLWSLLPKTIALQLPLRAEATWNETVSINGISYQVHSAIVALNDIGKSKSLVVEKTIQDIPGFANNQYMEIRTYEQGMGLTSFIRTPPSNLDFPQGDMIGWEIRKDR